MKRKLYKTLLAAYPIVNFLSNVGEKAKHNLDVVKKLNDLEKQETDIFVISYPKSGTTWLQMILFQLTTNGNLDEIDHLMRYSPHIEEYGAIGVPPNSRRIFKTHLKRKYWLDLNKGKNIYIMRDGLDVAVSYYHHHREYLFYNGTFREFLIDFFLGKVPYGAWSEHVSSWKKEKNRDNFIFLTYENLKSDLEGEILRIAKFCEISVSDTELKRIVDKSSFEYMKRHSEKLDLGSFINSHIHKFSEDKFIRQGKSGDRNIISEDDMALYVNLKSKYVDRGI